MAGHTEQSIIIDAPFQLVWDMTNDVSSWPGLFTEYACAEVIERQGDTVTFRLTMHPDEEGKTWSWVSQREMDLARREVRARRIETGPFEYMNIRWTYAQEAGGVRMTWIQDFQMKPSAPATDQQMTDRLNSASPIQLKVIKDRVEAAGRALAAQPAFVARAVPWAEIAPNRRRGAEIRVVLGPATVGSTSGFMGVAVLEPGECIAEHYHPYSEEFLYVVAGEITVDVNGAPVTVPAEHGLLVAVNTRHRLRNTGVATARAVFHLSPLAPRPELGHVDTEAAAEAAQLSAALAAPHR
jgi:quercetin dioxygenase-like cupin family protein/ribosome-associated toxin RatA of RatAB toxin-antitoxin module